MSPGIPRKTPLHSLHRELGARLVEFSGWEMPLDYAGTVKEHLAVRERAGLFDVSHMGEFEIEGPGALAFLQRVTSNNAARLAPGQAQYSTLPMPNGAPVDDVIIMRRALDRYLIVVNAANVDKDWSWLTARKPEDCALRNRSDDFALIALQGPRSEAILTRLTDLDLGRIASYHFEDGEILDRTALVSRTGYTGEDGFEIFVAPTDAEVVWRALLHAGRDHGLVPVGLGARDTLRLEARMLLYGSDMDETTTLFEAGLGWIVSFDSVKGDFIGREALAAEKQHGPRRKLVGFEVMGAGIARHGFNVFLDGALVGQVTSGTYAPYLKKSIGLCYLPAARAVAGEELEIDVRGRRVRASVVKTPFYKRPQ